MFVGYHVVWNVTPALHTPLMSVTNAISSVVIVRGHLAAGSGTSDLSSILGTIAVGLVAINTFGGFLVSQRMLEMFKKPGRVVVSRCVDLLHPRAERPVASGDGASRQFFRG